MIYRVPEKFYIRLHHPRPRFKNDIENVLLFMASEICALGELPNLEFKNRLTSSIRLYADNWNKTIKTIHNWRTEISALLGLIEYTESGYSRPSALAKALDTHQDLLQFFRYFCFKFQYPGGHLKPHESLDFIQKNVKFKPASYLIKVFREGAKLSDKSFGLSKEEATHLIFNDLRVVRDHIAPKKCAELILKHQASGTEYDRSGDVIRYAGDFLDYMVLANLLVYRPNGKYYLKTHELDVLNTFTESESYFRGYDNFYNNSSVTAADVASVKNDWFSYVNSDIHEDMFQADISDLFGEVDYQEGNVAVDSEYQRHRLTTPGENEVISEVLLALEQKKEASKSIRTKDIGDIGEAISIQHEKARLSRLGREDLARKVKKIPETYAVGYDLSSYEGIGELKRCIEVKTTISRNKLSLFRFRMTPNEWGSAETLNDAYYVYRLMVYKDGISLFVIKNPVALYKNDKIKMTPRDGVEIIYSDDSGTYEEVLA